MRQLLSLLFLIPCYLFCQERGIDFVENLSWQQVKEKAKQEQKYIMIDCYTSWCGPCKVMDQTTFKDPEVAKIANEGFVAVKVQFDEEDESTKLQKEWLEQSKQFHKEYNISAYPCILFFNPEGEIVHKVLGLQRVPNMLSLLGKVKNPDSQYYTLMEQYKKEGSKKENLDKLVRASAEAEENAQGYLKEYLSLIDAIDSKEDAQLVFDMTTNSKQHTFQLLQQYTDRINHFLGEGKAEESIRGIIYFEEIQSNVGRRSAMGYYILNPNPDWSVYEAVFKDKYANRVEDLMDYTKLNFYRVAFQWDKYYPELQTYITKYAGTISDRKKIEYASDVAKYAEKKDKEFVELINQWSKDAFKASDKEEDKVNLALLQYQINRSEKEHSEVEKAIQKLPRGLQYDYTKILKDINMGQKL